MARIFATFAAFLMVSVAFGVLLQPARADAGAAIAPPAVGAQATGPGLYVTPSTGGTQVAFLPTFQRWDGAYVPTSALNFTSGNWPYRVTQNATMFTITRLGSSFSQTKFPGAVYSFQPNEIKESLVLTSPASVPSWHALGVGLWGSYLPLVNGTTVRLLAPNGTVAWQTADFVAWDSSPVAHVYRNPVVFASWVPFGLTLGLDPTMLTWATYPLYVDPTWVLKGSGSNLWAGALDGATSDWGDANLRLGFLADNFNDNTNEIWNVTSGHSFSLSGGRAVLTATEIHASGSWTNVTLGTTLNFASCGAANVMFRYASSSNEYYLTVNFANGQVTLYKVINGVTTALSSTLSVSMSANTNYDVKVLARGNYFEVWWAGNRIWNGTDASPPGTPLSGNVGISETTSKCTLYVDNVRARDPTKWSGNYTAIKRGAASGNVVTQVRYLGTADSYDAVDLWINSSSDNATWGGWHLVKTNAAPAFYYAVPDVDQKRYYQIRAVLRTGVDGTPSVSEIDAFEASPPTVIPVTNTGLAPWTLYIGGDVNAVSGNLVLSWTDLAFRAKGFTIAATRTYNSALAGTMGPFGLGTTDTFHAKLSFPSGGNVTYTAGDGGVYTFVTMGATAYSPPRGLHDNLVKNADGTYTLWAPDGSRTNFDATGKLTSLVDRNGNHLTLTYTNGNPTKVADDSGLSLTLTHDASNRVTSVVDPVNRKVTYAYGTSGCSNCLSTVADPMGFTENLTYDASNRLTLDQDRAGHVDRFVYDGSGRVNQIWTGEWNYATGAIRYQVEAYAITYLSATQTTATNALGGATTATFNALGAPTSIMGPSVGCGLCRGGNATSYTWDGEFDPLTVADGRNDTTSYAYDWMGHALSVRDPGGNTTQAAYANVQNTTQVLTMLLSSTTPRGFTTRYSYYASGNLNATIPPGVNPSYRFYDASGSLTRSQDSRGYSVTYGYDSHEFLTSSTDAGGDTTTYQNDGIGRRWNTTSPGGNVSRTVYDLDSRVMSTKDPMGNMTTYAYDQDGRVTETTDPLGLTTTNVYNLTFGDLNQTLSTNGNKTRYGDDSAGDRVRIIDANSHTTNIAYDAYRRRVNTTTPLGHVTKYVYDAAGNVLAMTEPNGTLVRYVYDRSNRLLRTVYPGGATESTTYDPDGNVVESKAFTLDEFFVYDGLDRVVQTRQVYLDTALTLWHNYTYDADGNRLSMDNAGGGQYTWDKNGRVSTETDTVGNRWTFSYGKDGQTWKEVYPDSGYVTFTYDRDGRLVKEYDYAPSGALIQSLFYAYDADGRRVSYTGYSSFGQTQYSQTNPTTAVTSGLTVYALSPSPQIVTLSVSVTGTFDATGYNPPCPPAQVRFYYLVNGTPVNFANVTYVAGNRNMCYIRFWGNQSVSVNVRNGNVLQGEVTFENDSIVATSIASLGLWYVGNQASSSYVYDKESRLYKATYPEGTSGTYTYDAAGNRLTYASGGTTTTYSYDADNELKSSSDGTTFTYDLNGNTLTKSQGLNTTHYAYDYAGQLSPVSTTRSFATTAYASCGPNSDCTQNQTIQGLLTSPQNVVVSMSAGAYAEDDVDIASCPSATVSWSYVLNGNPTPLQSQTVNLVYRKLMGVCIWQGSASFSPTLTLRNGDSLYEEVTVTSGNPNVYGGATSMSLSTPPLPVRPYETMAYGPDGLLASEKVNQGAVSQRFGYDLLGAGGGTERVASYNGQILTTTYFYGVGSDQPLDTIAGGVSYYYHRDAAGSTTVLTGAGGSVAASYRYDAYGNLVLVADSVGNPIRYQDTLWDSTFGLVLDGGRAYDPTTGRYLSAGTSTPAMGRNLYAFEGDNPTDYTDPFGQMTIGPVPGPTGPGASEPDCSGFHGRAYDKCAGGSGTSVDGSSNAGVDTSSVGGSDGGQSRPVWTDVCTASLVFFAIGVGFALLIGMMPPSWQLQAWEARAVQWLVIGGGRFAFTENWAGLASTIFSILWWVLWSLWLPSLGFWDAALNSALLLGHANPIGIGLIIAQVMIQAVVLVMGLREANCIS